VSRFDIDDLVQRLVAAGTGDEPRRSVSEELERAVSAGTAMADAIRPDIGGLTILHHAPDLTILHLVWSPHMVLPAHDHRMWAAIAIYTGEEDNTFYRRSTLERAEIEESGGVTLRAGDVQLLGRETIHSVTNPLERHTGAIHVYGGDFVNEPRSQWGPGELVERPYDMDYISDLFAAERAAIRAVEEVR
jgi:predicted metal-dependent enzyme (double-stranded beta helix superfamily)